MPLVDAREQMIEQQVRAWEVLDARVLSILRSVPRERFAPESQRFLAFADAEVPLPNGQHMLRPSIVGRLLQALDLTTGKERVLEVGAGSGFVTACLAAASAHVTSFEVFADLADLARSNLASVGCGNAEVITADAMQAGAQLESRASSGSSASAAGFDAIAVTGSMPVYDDRFQRQLAVGGRLFIVVGDAPVMDARLVRRLSEDAWVTDSLFETVVDPLINARRPTGFAF